MGMDLLVVIEMPNWWRTTFNFDINVLEIMGVSTLDAQGKHAAKELLGKRADWESLLFYST